MGEKSKYVYVGNYNNSLSSSSSYQDQIDVLSKRLTDIENALSSTNIVKATPIISVISGDMNCLNYINKICTNWINYMSYIGNNNSAAMCNVDHLFWILDHFIFEDYFLQLKNQYQFHFISIDTIVNITEEQNKLVKEALEGRDLQNKEYVVTLIKNSNIYIFYFFEELYKLCNTNTMMNINNNDNNIQLKNNRLHPSISLDNSLIGNLDSKFIHMDNNNNLNDKRYRVIGSRRPYFNSLIDISNMNKLNSTLYGLNPALLNLSLIIVHAMLHLKCNKKEHDSSFMKQLMNYIPSVFFGHPMVPLWTL